MPEIEAPELELDDDAPTFRRRLALVVVLITLFGAGIAYLHESNGNLEDNAARSAQIASIKGFGQQVGASTEYRFDYRVFVQSQLLERRHVIATSRQNTTNDAAQAQIYADDSSRYGQLSGAIAGDTKVQDETTSASAVSSTLDTAPDKARLEQKVFANKANDYGNKADSYVAVLTVLAVGLFLIGLSLTIAGRGRYYLAAPGVAIAIVCVGWAAVVTLGTITKVSSHAIDLTAQGQALANSGDPKGAIDKFHEAIADSPQFGAAFARLADAEFEAGGTGGNGSNLQSLSTKDAAQRAIDAGEKAISLGEGNPSLLSNVGFYHFFLGQYDRAADLSEQALSSNDEFPPLVFNLAVAQVGKGEADAAQKTYERGISLLAKEQDNGARLEILSAARTDLEIAVDNDPSRKDLADKMSGRLASSEVPLIGVADEPVAQAGADSKINNLKVTTDRFRLVASYDAEGFADVSQLLNVWYFRPESANGQGPFEQTFALDEVAFTGSNPVSTIPAEQGDCLPRGDYRVEVYAGDQLLTSAEEHFADSALGPLVIAGGEDIGFTMCHPDGWKQQTNAQAPDSLEFANPNDAAQLVLVTNAPIGAGSSANADALLSARMSAAIEQEQLTVDGPPQFGQELLGHTVSGADASLPTTSVTGVTPQGEAVRITGSIASDDVLRVVIITAANRADLDLLRDQLVNSIRFLRVPPTTTPNGG